MTEQEIASIKEQIFDHSLTHTPTSNDVPTADTPIVDTPTTYLVPTDTPTDTSADVVPPVIDYNTYVKETFGFETVEEAKTKIAELQAIKDAAQKPIEYANEESKKVHELLLAGKVKDVKAIYDLQDKLETVDSLTPSEKIKLHIEQTNKHYKKADVEDVFEEKYNLPEKPVQGDLEDDTDFQAREERYKQFVEKINRRIERDSVTAQEELAKLKSEIKLPDIPTTPNPELDEFNAYKSSKQTIDDNHKVITELVSNLSETDISYKINFNDEAKKVNFDVTYQADKDGFNKAKEAATNYLDFIGSTYYKEDGSPLVDKLTGDIYKLQNFDKIMTEGINQAVNETMLQMARNQKNIGDGLHRNFNIVQPDAIQKLREQVFG